MLPSLIEFLEHIQQQATYTKVKMVFGCHNEMVVMELAPLGLENLSNTTEQAPLLPLNRANLIRKPLSL